MRYAVILNNSAASFQLKEYDKLKDYVESHDRRPGGFPDPRTPSRLPFRQGHANNSRSELAVPKGTLSLRQVRENIR